MHMPERLDTICERYNVPSEARREIHRWMLTRYGLGQMLDDSRVPYTVFNAGFEAWLDAICKQHHIDLPSAGRAAIVKLGEENQLLARGSERGKVLGNVLSQDGIYVAKRVLLAGLKAVDPETRWTNCSAEHVQYHGYQIVIGDDQTKKAKFIAACKAAPRW